MSGRYPMRDYRAGQPRRMIRTREPLELKMAVFLTIIAVALAVVAYGSSPWNEIWSSPTSRTMATIGTAGLIVPANFPYFLAATLVTMTLAVLAWRWAIRCYRGRIASGKTIRELQTLRPDHFEEWTAARFREMGYSVRLTGMPGDHGVDLLAEKPGEFAVVQCKKFKNWTVGEPTLRDLLGAMHHYGADRGYLVTTGRLTAAAMDWVRDKPIEIWDADYLASLSRQTAQPVSPPLPEEAVLATSVPTAPSRSDDSVRVRNQGPTAQSAAVCPKCGSALVERRNRQSGEPFLACPGYPKCRFTQPL